MTEPVEGTRMSALEFTLKKWSAWSPGLESRRHWQEWAAGEREPGVEGVPDLPELKPMFRRRLSPLSRMALRVAMDLRPEQGVASVFASRYGEMSRTLELLRTIVSGESVSPTAFGLSVHNAVSGLYTIGSKDRHASTAIAAAESTFMAGVMEAAAWLGSGAQEQVLLVYYDEPLPASYQQFADGREYACAVGMLLSRDGDGPKFRISSAGPRAARTDEPQAITWLRHLLQGTGQFELGLAGTGWHWQRHG